MKFDRKTLVFSAIIVVLLGTILGMGLKSENGFFGMNHSTMMDEVNSSSTSKLAAEDVMFLQMMIPHHQQAVDISNLALTKSKDAELIALATAIRDGQADEILTMRAWLKQAGASAEMGHSMAGSMGGVLDAAELKALTDASGANFDRLWLQGMTGHHEGAIAMTAMIKTAQNPEIKSFGQQIVVAQTGQMQQMQLMLKRIG